MSTQDRTGVCLKSALYSLYKYYDLEPTQELVDFIYKGYVISDGYVYADKISKIAKEYKKLI